MGLRAFKLGFSPFVPWFDHHFVMMAWKTDFTVEQFYSYSLDWLDVSDAVLLVPGWENSKGTKAELKRAAELGIPVFESLYELKTEALNRERAAAEEGFYKEATHK